MDWGLPAEPDLHWGGYFPHCGKECCILTFGLGLSLEHACGVLDGHRGATRR